MNIPPFSSSGSLSDETRLSILRIQARLIDAQKELSTGRHADVGLTLGAATGKVISFRQELNVTQSIIDSNGVVATRLKGSQIALQSMSTLAQDFLAALTNTKTSTGVAHITMQKAQSDLKAFLDQGNATIDGQYIFSGINSDVKPFDDYYASAPPASKQAYDAAFLAKFGFTQQDPAAASIDAATMSSFVNTEVAAEFADPAWATNWSSASDKNIKNRISRMELAETSVNANDPAFRKIMSALVMVGESGFDKLNDTARQVVIDKAIGLLGEGITGIAALQSRIGIAEERLSKSNDVMTLQKNLFTSSMDSLEGVDPAEVQIRLSNLMTQIETAYTITSRLNNLSLMNYLNR